MPTDYAAIKEYALSAFPPSITWQVKQVPNDTAEPDEWKRNAAKFQLALTNGRVSETFNYWMGCGHWKWKVPYGHGVPEGAIMAHGRIRTPAECLQSALLCFQDKARIIRLCRCDAPHPIDIIHCLLLDASAAEQTFDEWCGDFGYDTDIRKAEETYRACDDVGKRLYRVLGRDLCDTIRQRIDERGGL